jgi:hypothetical protein
MWGGMMDNALIILGFFTVLLGGVGIIRLSDRLIYFATGRSFLDALEKLLMRGRIK